jgi:hypothetical protein
MGVGVKVQVCGSRSLAEGPTLLVIEGILNRDPMEALSLPRINLLVIERDLWGDCGICPYPRKRHMYKQGIEPVFWSDKKAA